MIQRIITGTLIFAVVGLGVSTKFQAAKIDTLKTENAALMLALSAAEAKQANIQEDTQSDAKVDNIPDDGLRVVPDHWLLPQAPVGSGG